MPPAPLALCLEQTLGHRAHTLNLEREAAHRPRTTILKVEYPGSPRLRLPWALRGSVDAARQLRRLATGPAATLFHTSTISLAARSTRTPYLVSVDATPVQLDSMGAWYRHRRASALLEAAKKRWYESVFRSAHGMIAWSRWAAASLTADYGVDPARITILHPGAGTDLFALERRRPVAVPTILFVGGDFERKGGVELLTAFAALRVPARLVLVTPAALPELPPGVEVLRGVTPGSPALLRAYAEADIFCLPTKGDCTSVAIEEAMAAGLPVITTPVGSNADTVPDGTGMLVPAGDTAALADALTALAADRPRRDSLARAARELARDAYNAEANARRLFDALEAVA
jgi:glycosyltransferase involved in cell wall biosynthesis